MFSIAWPLMFHYDLYFGPKDKLSTYSKELILHTKVFKGMGSSIIDSYLLPKLHIPKVKEIFDSLGKSVPNSFITPWSQFMLKQKNINNSHDSNDTSPYLIDGEYIILDEDWYDYFIENFKTLSVDIKKRLYEFLRLHNQELKLTRYKLGIEDDSLYYE